MTYRTRLTLMLTLILALATGLFAQQTTTTAETTDPAATVGESTSTSKEVTDTAETIAVTEEGEANRKEPNYELLNTFTRLIERHPSDLAMILALDPSLLADEHFVARYPELAAFVAKYPEIRRNPRFFMGEFSVPGRHDGGGDTLEAMVVFSSFLLVAFALAWFIRTIIEQKRWNRLSQTQSEVHNKILDRFSSSEELLAYIKTPAGTKFLESAPIPLHADAEQPAKNAPLTRVLRSIQIGIVVAAGALGMLLVGVRLKDGDDLFALGVIGFCVGGGFIASAIISLILSRRLGLWKGPGSVDESELVR